MAGHANTFGIATLVLFICCISQTVNGQKYWYGDFTPGLSYTPPLPLVIRQKNHERLSFRAKYKSEPLKLPFYYSCRLGFTEDGKSWDVEMNHLKIYLTNLNEEVSRFNISHGFNQVFINRGFERTLFTYKAGLGFVLAHPENTVRGLSLNEKKGIFGKGYYLAGPAIQVALSNKVPVSGLLNLLMEVKLSFGYSRIPVAGGKADVPVIALHFQAGPHLRIKKAP